MSLKTGSLKKNEPQFEKKPKNPHTARYAHVQGVIDSGPTVAKQKPEITANELSALRQEIFKRVNIAKLAEALEAKENNCESIFNLADNTRYIHSCASKISSLCTQKTAQTVVSVVDSEAAPESSPGDDLLVLDVRTKEEFARAHLQHAINFEKKRLNQDQISPELWAFKRGGRSKKLVVYDINDRLSAEMATLMVQKGWENVYALTGGLEEVATTYAELIEGEFDPPVSGRGVPTGRMSKPSCGSSYASCDTRSSVRRAVAANLKSANCRANMDGRTDAGSNEFSMFSRR